MKITFRSVIIGLMWVIVQTMVTPYNNIYLWGSRLAGSHFPMGAMIVLLLMASVVNTILRKLKSGWELDPGELLVVWLMVVVASGIPGLGLGQFLYTTWKVMDVLEH